MYQKALWLSILALSALSNSCKAQSDSNSMQREKLLVYQMRKADSASKKSPMLILLHGHGSNENDLFSLHESIPKNWIVVSVRGSYLLAENSYRWYDVKMVNGKISINIEQEEESKNKLLQLISYLTEKHRVDSSKIVVAGFSQGANMSQSLGLSMPHLIAGFGVFSGRYVEEIAPYISKSDNLKQTKAFISHGSGDRMLPQAYATENLIKLKELGIQTTYSEDTNDHSISSKQLETFISWLKNI